MIGPRLDGRNVTALLIASVGLLLASPAAYGTGTIDISKAVMVVKDSPTQEVTYGLADAIVSVGFRGQATCTCTCDDSNLTYTWHFGDDTTANGKNVSHTYGENGKGNRSPTLHVACTCGASAVKDGLTAGVIWDIRVDRIGDKTNPDLDGRLCFNTELRVAATALPAGVSGSNKIDWHVRIPSGTGTAVDLDDSASGSLPNLPDGSWPTTNSAWGANSLYCGIKDNDLILTGVESNISNTKYVKTYYNATTSENSTTAPNWFYYYKINQGGSDYTYRATGRSTSVSAGGMATVEIGNEAYAGDEYITHDYSNPGGRLKALGASDTNYYYANFLGVLAHETQHATQQTNAGPPADRDSDRLANAFETDVSKTDPDDDDSAQGNLTGTWYDREVYAGGPVEKGGIDGANTSNDWAHPGTNWHP